MRPRHFFRLLRIYKVLRTHRLQEVVALLKPQGPFGESRKKIERRPDLGKRIRLALEDLGPIFVKFGQALSTRPDLLPPDIALELAKLQDKVPPFSGEEAQRVVETAFDQPVSEIFKSFNNEPLASASIAQVHDAVMHDGTEVVVKVLRPGIDDRIEQDLDVLGALANLAHRHASETRRLRPKEIVEEYSKTIRDELDFHREAANASQLKRNWENKPIIQIPEVYWDYCHSNVMVMEKMFGVPISDVDTLRANNVNMQVLAERGVEIFFTQVFDDNFFHADMHPGNIFVDISDPEDPSYVSIDFGIVGTLDPADQQYLAGNLLAFFHRDYRKVAQLHIDSQWVPLGTRVDEFESAIRTVCEPIFNKPLKDISFGQFLVRLFATARRFNMEVQPQLVLLQKTLLNIEGLGRQLYPDLDLWETAKPFLEDWMKRKTSGKHVMEKLQASLPELGESAHEIPVLILRALKLAANGNLGTQQYVQDVKARELLRVRRERRHFLTFTGCTALISTTVLISQSFEPTWLTALTAITGVALLVWSYRTV